MNGQSEEQEACFEWSQRGVEGYTADVREPLALGRSTTGQTNRWFAALDRGMGVNDRLHSASRGCIGCDRDKTN